MVQFWLPLLAVVALGFSFYGKAHQVPRSWQPEPPTLSHQFDPYDPR